MMIVDRLIDIAKGFKNLETGNLKHLHRNELLDKACFADDAAYFDSKDLTQITISDKILNSRANEMTRHLGYQRALASMV